VVFVVILLVATATAYQHLSQSRSVIPPATGHWSTL